MKVVWSAQAQSRLAEIHDYIAERSAVDAARVVARLLDRADLIAAAPKQGARIARFGGGRVREVLTRPYRIIYVVEDARIVILSVKHYRQRLIDGPAEF